MSNCKKESVVPVKRFFDVLLSFFIIFTTLPFSIFALTVIKIEQILRGRPFDPLFYSETRIGHGKKITLYKFNIFKYEQVLSIREKGELVHTKKLEHNGGILFTGWILKQIYMDELPQFFYVLRGVMSVVGPRPLNVEVYNDLINSGICDKDRVPAGITGYYQSFKNTTKANSAQCDKYYADYYSTHSGLDILIFDLKIILRTLKVILRAKGV